MNPTSSVKVFDIVGDLGGLDPDKAAELAKTVISVPERAAGVSLDFAGVSTISSAFANTLFLALADAAPLSLWQRVLKFAGLDRRQAEVLARSLKAARNVTGEAAQT